jgi:hypothetical protein
LKDSRFKIQDLGFNVQDLRFNVHPSGASGYKKKNKKKENMEVSKNNRYAIAARKKKLMGLGNLPAKVMPKQLSNKTADLKVVGKQVMRDTIIGGIGGALAGTILGRYSFLVGIVVTALGHANNSPALAGFGVGMMASGGYQGMNLKGTNGLDGIEGVKERFLHFKDNMKRQFFIDKLENLRNLKNQKNGGNQRMLKSTREDESTNGLNSGLNNVQYIRHEDAVNEAKMHMDGLGEADLSELRRIEAQLETSAREYAQRQNRTNEVSGDTSGRLI